MSQYYSAFLELPKNKVGISKGESVGIKDKGTKLLSSEKPVY
jgi:hypothetical protein